MLVKVKAKRKNKVATFMPKPIFGDNASAMHTHQSLWNGETNAMYDPDDDVAQMSQIGRYYIGGIFDHALHYVQFQIQQQILTKD